MGYRILLYGATGFSGRLIAAEATERWSVTGARCELVLGARDEAKLRHLAHRYGAEYRAFTLDHEEPVLRELKDIDVVINAAGPFALTAGRLLKAALKVGCHYVDINGEIDVYKRLDDCGRIASQRQVTVVCSAGHMSTTSDLLLDSALAHLKDKGIRELGAVRIAMSRIMHVSRGSTSSALRSLREQVTVVRDGSASEPVLWHAPVGRLERTFDCGVRKQQLTSGADDLRRIASAANLVDTLTARVEVIRHQICVHRIESYMEMGTAGRIGYQLGSMGSPLLALPCIRAFARSQVSLLPDGPTAEERGASPNVVLLEIEDAFRTPVIDLRLEGPNIYDVTAEVVTRIAERVAEANLYGWRTPAEVLGERLNLDKENPAVPLRGCRLERRVTIR